MRNTFFRGRVLVILLTLHQRESSEAKTVGTSAESRMCGVQVAYSMSC
jgi:hypothetical protein